MQATQTDPNERKMVQKFERNAAFRPAKRQRIGAAVIFGKAKPYPGSQRIGAPAFMRSRLALRFGRDDKGKSAWAGRRIAKRAAPGVVRADMYLDTIRDIEGIALGRSPKGAGPPRNDKKSLCFAQGTRKGQVADAFAGEFGPCVCNGRSDGRHARFTDPARLFG
jgi:hypothetical protein